MSWGSAAGALLAVAIGLAVAAPGAAGHRRRSVRLGTAVIAVAAANAVVVIVAHGLAVQVLALATGLALVIAVHRWAAALRHSRGSPNRTEPHEDTERR